MALTESCPEFFSNLMYQTKAIIWLLIITLLTGCCATNLHAANATKPNIVFIMIDDLGWSDLAVQGNPLVDTPRIDQFARQGMRFTNAYAAAPVCSPTRAAVLTGLAPARLHITNHIPDQPRFTPKDAELLPAPMVEALDPSYTTVAEMLADNGYATGFFGKWHVSGKTIGREGLGEAQYYPEIHGFDINIGGFCYGGPPTFFDPYRIHSLPSRKEGEYLPFRLVDEVNNFITTNKDNPFFVMLWPYTVHWPMEAPAPLVEKYKDRTGPGLNDTRYGAMIEAMDDAIGRLLEHLDSLDLSDDTLIVFTSDNGGFAGVADNRPLRAAKGHLYEGGIRVPLFIKWPGRIAAGSVSDENVISMDFFPTLLDAAGIRYRRSGLDGVSLFRHISSGQPLRRDAIYFHYPNYAWHSGNRLGGAVRSGNYKLIKRYADDSLELYNLEDDLSESTNLASENPVLTANLSKKLDRWLNATGANMPIHPSTQQGSSEE